MSFITSLNNLNDSMVCYELKVSHLTSFVIKTNASNVLTKFEIRLKLN